MNKKSSIYIVQEDETENINAAYQEQVEQEIKNAENANVDLNFKVIGKINEPNGPKSLPIDFNEDLIQWYDGEERSPEFIKKTILAIVNLIS